MALQADQRARLRDALVGLCSERGFRRVELDALLARAQLDEAAFGRCFADLEDCFLGVFEGELDRYRREAAPDLPEIRDWRDRVRAAAYALFRFLAVDPKLSRFLLVESRLAGERTQLLAGQQLEALSALIDEGRRELPDPGSLTRATAEALAGGVFNQAYVLAARSAPWPPEEEVVPKLMYCIVLPYAGRAAAQRELAIPPPPSAARPRPSLARRG